MLSNSRNVIDMRIKTILVTLFLMLGTVVSAQESNLILSDFQVTIGTSNMGMTRMTETELKSLLPIDSEHLFYLDQDNSRSPLENGVSNSFGASVMLRFKEESVVRTNPRVRLGFMHHSFTDRQFHIYQEDVFRIDTLVSSQTGEETYIDSISRSSMNAEYRTQQLRFDASMVFSTAAHSRFSVYTGIGVTLGLSFNNRTHVNLYESLTEQGLVHESVDDHENGTIYNNQGGASYSCYLPLGIEYLLSEEHELWNSISLLLELRPSMDVIEIPELKTYVEGDVQLLFGFRIDLTKI